MRVLAIVGEQVALSFSVAGLETVSPKDHNELLRVFHETVEQSSVAMLVISARYATALKKEIEEVRISRNPIVILEISSSQGDYKAGDRLMQAIKQTIG